MKKILAAMTVLAMLVGCADIDTGQAPEGYQPKGAPASAGALGTPGAVPCQECGKKVGKGDIVKLHDKFVCKDCNAAHKH